MKGSLFRGLLSLLRAALSGKVSLSESFLNQQFCIWWDVRSAAIVWTSRLLSFLGFGSDSEWAPVFHPAGCRLNTITSHWKDRGPGRAPRIDNDNDSGGYVPTCHASNMHWIFPLILSSMVLDEVNTPTARCCWKCVECRGKYTGHTFNSFIKGMCFRRLWPLWLSWSKDRNIRIANFHSDGLTVRLNHVFQI